MASRTQSAFQTVKTEGALLPADILKRVSEGDSGLEGLSPESYHLDPAEKINEATNRAWTVCREAWQRFQKARADLPAADKGTTATRERWLLKLFQELGYGRLQTQSSIEIEGKTYAISHGWGAAPIHLISFRYDLDRSIPGVLRTSPHSLVQELLNRSDDHLWAFLSNGLQLRILRDNVSFTRSAYVEFDLETMMEGEVYSDFVLLWLLCHQSRVEADKPEQCWLEKWHQTAKQQGTRALDRLRDGVEKAIETFGQGFLGHRANTDLRQKLADGNLSTKDYYQQLLRLVYRLIFLFVAEDRDLLLSAGADASTRERYNAHYSMSRLRQLAQRRRGTRHSDLWRGIRLVFGLLYKGEPRLGLPALGSMLFSSKATPDLDGCELQNDALLEALRHLAFTVDRRVLRHVDYKNLGSEELGSVYESLLELHPDVNADAATFELSSVAGSERKTTGSYYTPSSLINCLLDSALDPVVEDRLKGKTGADAEKALLDLKVCDPACGSGHFLIAAANRIAKRLAAVRTGDEEPSPADQRAAFRDVVSHCIYGVDINPMAVELCKVALWLESIDPGRPLSFLDHRIQCGNSLIGATPRLLKEGIPDDAFKPIEGDDKAVCKEYKQRNKDERKGQMTFDFGAMPSVKLGNLPQTFANLAAMDDGSLEDVQAKEKRYADLVGSTGYQSARLLADAWCAAFVWKKDKTTDDCITESWFRRIEANPHCLPPWMREEIERHRDQYQFFHWQLAFPDVFAVPREDELPNNKRADWHGGFDAVIGNPPWDLVAADQGERAQEAFARQQYLYKSNEYTVLSGRRDLYKLFLVRGSLLPSPKGVLGILTPFGGFVEDDSRNLRHVLYDEGSVLELRHFQNHRKSFFPHVHASYRFCAFVYAPTRHLPHRFTTVARLPEEIASQVDVEITRDRFDEQLGNERAAILYPSGPHALIHQSLTKRFTQIRNCAFEVTAEFHASTDKNLTTKDGAYPANWVLLKNRNIHQFDYRFSPPEAYVAHKHVVERLVRKSLSPDVWLESPRLVFRDIARNDDERTLIACLAPPGHLSSYDTPLAIPNCLLGGNLTQSLLFYCAVFNSFLFDFLIRPYVDKHVKGYTLNRVAWPVAEESFTSSGVAPQWVASRVLELVYIEHPTHTCLRICGYDGQPFRWDNERRLLIRCELDAAFFHLYGIERDDVDYIMETFPIVKRKDEAAHGHYRTKDTILEIYDEMAEAVKTGKPYHTRLDPAPGPPADAEGNFLPLSEWKPGDPRPADWPRHIHAPREVYDWAKANDIDWRKLLEPLGEENQFVAHPKARSAVSAPAPASALPGLESVAADVEASESRREREKEFVLEAFRAVRSGRSPDFVVADPELNAAFVEKARVLGAESGADVLNRTLLGLRKASQLQGEKTTKPYRLPATVVPYVFASEWAVRHLQRTLLVEANREPALDEILCDPTYAARFDELVARIKPGFSPLEYRWAALGLRKQSRQSPDESAVSLPLNTQLLLDGFDPKDLPELPGLYLIAAPDRSLYVHETDNLRDQMTRHLDTAGEALVPDWLLTGAVTPGRVAYTVLSDRNKLREARIRSVTELQPWLNLIDLPGAA